MPYDPNGYWPTPVIRALVVSWCAFHPETHKVLSWSRDLKPNAGPKDIEKLEIGGFHRYKLSKEEIAKAKQVAGVKLPK